MDLRILKDKARLDLQESARLVDNNIYASADNGVLKAMRLYGDDVDVIPPVDQPDVSIVATSDRLIQAPGCVLIDHQVFDLARNGIYRFVKAPTIGEQRMVCTPGDVNSYLNMAGYLWSYGNTYNFFPEEHVDLLLTKERMVAACSKLAFSSKVLCDKISIESRVVRFFSTDLWDGQDDRHRLQEIKADGQWILYDPSVNSCLRTMDGRRASLLDVWKSGFDGLTVETLPGKMPVGEFIVSNGASEYNYGFWSERLITPSLIKEWYKHVMHVPALAADGGVVFPVSAIKEKDRDRFNTVGKAVSEEEFFNAYHQRAGLTPL